MKTPEDQNAPRFHLTIDLRKLERESRKYFYIGILLGMVFHLFLCFFIPYKHVEIKISPVKAIPMTLIDIPIPETEPLEITPPEPRQKSYVTKQYRQGVPSKDIETTVPAYDEASPSMMGLGDTLYESYDQQTIGKGKALPGPLSNYQGMKDTIERRSKGRISVTDEMISISDLDTGQYKSMLILDPTDPLNTKGYVHIPAAVEGITFKPNPAYRSAVMTLAEGFYRHTGITLKEDRVLQLSSRDLHKYPFIYLSWDEKGIEFAQFEADNFREYLNSGGFALAEIHSEFFWEFYDYIDNTFDDKVKITSVPDYVYASLIDMQPHDKDDGVYINSKLCIIHSNPCKKDHTYALHWQELDTVYMIWGINILYHALMQSTKTEMMVDDSSRAIQNLRQWWDYRMQKKYNDMFETQ